MAAGDPLETGVTRIPGGVAQFQFYGKAAVAGNVVCTGVKKSRDKLIQVVAYTLSGVLIKDSNDYTNEFTILSNDFLNNTGGTSTAGKVIVCTVARNVPY